MHLRITILVSILWFQEYSTQNMQLDLDLWQQVESKFWVHQAQEAQRIP